MNMLNRWSHGVLDYMTVGFLWMLPRALRWNRTVTNTLTGAALGTLLYSMLTRYELGLIPRLPFRTHLTLDTLNGLFFCASPILFRNHHKTVQAAMVGIGMFELAAVMATEDEPEAEQFTFEPYEGALREYSPI